MNKTVLNFIGVMTMSTMAYSQVEQPNIIFILADDWGWTDWQMNNGEYASDLYETPCLNRMAQQGIFFSQAYATPLSSPSRAALLTGKYPGARLHMHQAITGKSVNNPILPEKVNSKMKTCFPSSLSHLPLYEITIAEELQGAGYKTYQFGKWHLGGREFYPIKNGFDEEFAVGGAAPGPGGYFAPYKGMDNIEPLKDNEYITERLTDEVCKVIVQKQEKPFFIYMAHYNVHSPYQGREDLVKKYSEKISRTNSKNHKHPVMAAMVESLDASVGRVMDELKKSGKDKNTIVIVMGDNGGVNWTSDRNYPTTQVTTNAPLRGGKCCFYEGGVRVPLLIWSPQTIKETRIEKTPVHLIDFYPTLVELAKGTISKDKDCYDGVSILPLLKGGLIKERPLFCHFPRTAQIDVSVGGSSVRVGDYKLYRFYGLNEDCSDVYELYNIANDISENNNIINQNKKKADDMINILNEWLCSTGAYVPHPNPEYNPNLKQR